MAIPALPHSHIVTCALVNFCHLNPEVNTCTYACVHTAHARIHTHTRTLTHTHTHAHTHLVWSPAHARIGPIIRGGVHSCGVFQLVARTARKVSTIAHHDGSAAHSVSTKHHDAVTEVFSSFFVSSLVPTCYPGKHGSMEAWKQHFSSYIIKKDKRNCSQSKSMCCHVQQRVAPPLLMRMLFPGA